ncbi:MAG: antitermination protein NusG, partial [Pseudomonadota bacterium]
MENTDIVYFFMRWLHYFFGIIWIGHLYYFNFTQVPFFGETDATTKSNAIQKLVPRALWWFRWGAMFTFITGLIMLSIWGSRVGGDAMKTSFGLFIMVGATLGTLMFLNVWLIIWPCQKVVIESTTNAAQGKPALPNAAAKGAAAFLASR